MTALESLRNCSFGRLRETSKVGFPPSVVRFLSSHSFNSQVSSFKDSFHTSVVTEFGSVGGLLQVDNFQFSSLNEGKSLLHDCLFSTFGLSSSKSDSSLSLNPSCPLEESDD